SRGGTPRRAGATRDQRGRAAVRFAPAPHGHRRPAVSDGSPVADSARHLLVVDDEPHIGLVLRPYLEELGYVVSVARTLDEARSALRTTPATDGLLLDLHLRSEERRVGKECRSRWWR